MPNLKDRYSDAELDRSSTAFDEMVDSHPDMQELNDRGDEVIRDLNKAENTPDQPGGVESGDADATRQAETDNGDGPSNRFNYQKNEKQQKGRGLTNWSNRKKIIVGGGIGGSLIGLVAGLMLLLPMKVPGMMSLVTQEVSKRAEQITEKQAKLIIGRAILTKFGTHTGIVLTGDGAFKTLVASMRTSGFEKRLAAKGLVISQTPDGVKLTQNGRPLGGGRSLTNEKAIMDALESDRVSNKILNNIIKEEIPSWRLMKRVKFAKWLRIKYGIPKYGLTRSDATNDEDRAKEYDKQRVESANRRVITNFTGLIGCIMTGQCEGVNETGDRTKVSEEDARREPVDQASEAADEQLKIVSEKGIAGLTTRFHEVLLKVFGSKAVPVVGWIDLVATLDHIIYVTGKEDYLGKVIAYYRGAAYAAIYAEWSGYGSQVQLGELEPSYVGQLADELNGAEEAVTFQAIQGKSGGIPIEMKVNSDRPSETSKAFKTYLESGWGSGYKYAFHPVMNFYYETLGTGGFMGWLAEGIGGFFGKVFGPLIQGLVKIIGTFTPDSVKKMAENIVKDILPYILKTFGLSIDAFERGAKLFNNIMGGGVVSWNEYGKDSGYRRLTDSQAAQQNASVEQARLVYRQEQGVLYSLFSKEEASSLTSQLARSVPTSPTESVASLGKLIQQIPAQLANTVMPRTSAVPAYENLFGVAMYGALQSDLERPLSPIFLSGGECPENKDDEFNECLVQQRTAEAMLCEFQPDTEDCSDQDPRENASDGISDFSIATYNVLGASHSDGNGNRAGEVDSDRRMKLIVDILRNNDVSIVGLQEFENRNRQLFLQDAGALYDLYPSQADYGKDKPSANSIAWRKSEFSLVKGETRPILYFDGNQIQIPVVRLKHIGTGQEFYVTNTHDPANTQRFPRQQQYRVEDARRHIEYITNLHNREKLPVLFTGDFNSSFDVRNPQDDGLSRSEITYCILTNSGLVRNSYDVAKNRDGACPTRGVGYIDHIYVTNDVKVTDWQVIKNSDTSIASDHYPFIAGIDIGGDGGSTGAKNGWAWPLGEQAWKQHRSSHLGSHYNGGGFLGVSGYSVDISWGESDTGSPIYSMLDGVVETQPLGRSSYSCSGTPNANHNGGMIVKSNIGGRTVRIAYAHGSNPQFTAGQPVKAGQQILKLGNVGNSCGSHLHMDITYDGKGVCPQDVFLSLDKNQSPELGLLTQKASIECRGRL